jgi:hypothetical protein
MRPDRRFQGVVAGSLAAAALVVVLAAAPAASTAGTGSHPRQARAAAPRAIAIRSAPGSVAPVALVDRSPFAEAHIMANAANQRRHDAWLSRLRAWKHQQASRTRAPVTSTAPSHRSGGSVRDLVASLFARIAGPGQVATALCVASRESRFNPYARNPSSSAAGVFQWLASSWRSYSARYGFGGSSVFDAYANVAVAAHAVADGGWGPWGGGCW